MGKKQSVEANLIPFNRRFVLGSKKKANLNKKSKLGSSEVEKPAISQSPPDQTNGSHTVHKIVSKKQTSGILCSETMNSKIGKKNKRANVNKMITPSTSVQTIELHTVDGIVSKKQLSGILTSEICDNEEHNIAKKTKLNKKSTINTSLDDDSDTSVCQPVVTNGSHLVDDIASSNADKAAECSFDEETIDGDIINIDQYRLPYEHDEHWQIRRAFLEKNQHVLPLQKLLSLAQAYMNVKTLGCQYAPLTMKRISKYSKGIDDDYHQSRVHTLKRVLITASDAAAFKVRREDPIVSAKLNDSNVKQNLDQTDQHSTMPPAHIMNIVRNKIIILNNCLNNTMEAFNNQNTGIKMMQYSCKGSSEHCGFIKIGGFVVGKGEGITAKRALKSAADDAMIFLSKHCYSLTRKKQATKVESIAVISVEDSKSSSSTTNEYIKIGSDNVGFKMMAKFGWTGGSLGTKDNGILDPVNVEQKLGREGLGQKGKLNRNMIRQKLKDLHDGKLQDQDHLVFSNEYSKAERKLIHSLAASFGLKSQSYGSELQGNRQLVVQRNVKPLDLLRKVMIDKDPIYTEMYDVTCPTENSPQ